MSFNRQSIVQIAGVAMHELSPFVITLISNEQKRRDLVKAAEIQRGSFKEMRKVIVEEGYGKLVERGRSAGAPLQGAPVAVEGACPTCNIHSTKTLLSRTWLFLHQIPDTMPHSGQIAPEMQSQYGDYVTSILANLPCPECSRHAMAYVQGHPIDTSSREALTGWMCNFHNDTRVRLGQPVMVTCDSSQVSVSTT